MDNGKWDQALKEANGGMPNLPMPDSQDDITDNKKEALGNSVEALYDVAEKNGIDRETINKMLGLNSMNSAESDGVRLGELNQLSTGDRMDNTEGDLASQIDEIDKLLNLDEPTEKEKETLVEALPGEKLTKDRAAGIKDKKHQRDIFISEAENINAEAEKSGNVNKQLAQVALLRESVLRELENHVVGAES